MEELKGKERKERKGKGGKGLQRGFFNVSKRRHVTASRAFQSASNPISQKVLSFMGQII